jgi:glycosyltransferase involved in cell wall biosynthesis
MGIDYSIIIPAYNEAEYLPSCLNKLKDAMSCVKLNGEIIVVDNNSSDNTAELAKGMGAKVVFEPFNQIAKARNTGGRNAAGRYLIFVDADTLLNEKLLLETLNNLESGRICGGGVIVDFDDDLPWILYLFLKFWNFFAPKFGIAAGCFVYCLKDAFDEIGGFDERVYASEEVWFSKRLISWGKKKKLKVKVITNCKIETSARKMKVHNSFKTFFILFMLGLGGPWLVRHKRLCSLWYKR